MAKKKPAINQEIKALGAFRSEDTTQKLEEEINK